MTTQATPPLTTHGWTTPVEDTPVMDDGTTWEPWELELELDS